MLRINIGDATKQTDVLLLSERHQRSQHFKTPVMSRFEIAATISRPHDPRPKQSPLTRQALSEYSRSVGNGYDH